MNVSGKDIEGHDIETLINKDFVITDSYNFFEFNEEGNVKTAQILLTNGAAINMALRIYTDPYYFEFTTPIDYYTSENFALIHPIVAPVFNTINEHVLSTINILILMKYEFNDIELTCNNFPNSNGVIFHLNEESQVEFKEMLTDNTQDEIKLQLISKNEPLTLSLLKSLYGNISISLDWVCF